MSEDVKLRYIIILCTIMMVIFVILLFYGFNSEKKKTRYYKYKVNYDEDLSKHSIMLKHQKKVLFKKKIQLSFLKFLVRIKGV